MAYTVEVNDLRKSFGEHRVLAGVDLTVSPGSVTALLGSNGAGKTTLVRILSTLSQPDAGSARVAGHDVTADPLAVRREISLTGQFAAIDEMLTAGENLDMIARLRKLTPANARRRRDELLAEFDLIEARDRRTGTFSGGMKRRLDLAMSMVAPPTLLFLDEPTTGLDPRSREQVWTTISALVADGVTVLLTTQYLDEADRLADSISVLHEGRIVADGTPAELKARVGGDVLRLELEATDLSRTLATLGGTVDHELHTVDVPTDGTARHLADLLRRLDHAGIEPRRVSTRQPSLDDVFWTLTERTLA